jgi:hypothetical protein
MSSLSVTGRDHGIYDDFERESFGDQDGFGVWSHGGEPELDVDQPPQNIERRKPTHEVLLPRRNLAAGVLTTIALAANASDADEIAVTILEPGDTSSALPQRVQTVVVDYTLWINDFGGKEIDSSKGSVLPPRLPSPFKFQVGVGQVIAGWDRTVRSMHVGETRRVVIPPSLGYGEKGFGPIPGGAKLFFEMTLLEVKPMPTLSAKQQEWLDTHPER